MIPARADILKLVKHRLSAMVAVSALAGYLFYPGHIGVDFFFVFFGVLAMAMGTSALNQIQEYRYDALMDRTKKRPLPSGAITPSQAAIISIMLTLIGTLILLFSGWIPMLLGILNIVFYNLIYTPMKRKSILAIIPGGFVGAVPPLIGWTAAGGNWSDAQILYIAIFIFLWQLPHFWLLMIKYGKEYETAGFSTISQNMNEHQIKRLVFFWITVTTLFLLTYPFFGISLSTHLFIAFIILNIGFIFFFHRLLFRASEPRKVMGAFIVVNLFMLMVLTIMVTNVVA